ncbi:WD40-repeat-containing domain protein [Geranomyces variabilis]|nr:WD40-repeat-containing domain protein [Geranomyces variabilis]KAJ3141275.1 hypothetical protein HDU90_007302 [Geranomyces variabilis]
MSDPANPHARAGGRGNISGSQGNSSSGGGREAPAGGSGIHHSHSGGNDASGQPSQQAGLTSYTLPGVLHFLQVEWRRFERERNEWQVERADLKARVAFLEGERRGTENLKMDLMRRVKMLEFALRQERGKFTKLQTEKQSSSPTPGEQSSTQSQGQATLAPPVDALPTLPDNVLSAPSNYGTLNLSGGTGTLLNYSKGYGHMRSKEILKNYLREMGFLLTGSGTGSTSASSGGAGETRPEDFATPSVKMESPSLAREATRTRRPITVPSSGSSQDSPVDVKLMTRNAGKKKPRESIASVTDAVSPPGDSSADTEGPIAQDDLKQEGPVMSDDSNHKLPTKPAESSADQPPLKSSPGPAKDKIPLNEAGSAGSVRKSEEGHLTAEELRELKLTPEKLSKVMRKIDGKPPAKKKAEASKLSAGIPSVMGNAMALDGDALASLALNDDDTDEGTKSKKGSKKPSQNQRIWRPKAVLRNHLDAIRAIAFSAKDSVLLTSSEDNTTKLWNVAKVEGNKSSADVEPIYTFRGHTEPVTSLALSASGETCYSGSGDATIRVWQVPPANRDSYSSYENSKNFKLHTYVGHSDIIWDLKLHPLPQQSPSLASVSSDGSLKIWNTTPDERALRTTMWYNGASHGGGAGDDGDGEGSDLRNPTSVDWLPTNLNKLAVSYQNSVVKVFDAETGQVVLVCKSNETFDGTANTQINKLVAHPLLPLLITAHEDRHIRIFDINTGAVVHSMVAHQDSVSALDISADGLSLVSGGHDCSLRWWDLSTRKCVQEYTSHRRKNDEGIWAARFHPEDPHLMASGGADGVCKLYAFGSGT